MIIKHKLHLLRYLPHGVVMEVQELGGGCCCLNVGRLMSTAATAAREVVANDDGSGSKNNKRRGVKMSKQERRSMVVDFVNKYRLMNEGKFPTPNYTKDQVGGSYYTVRAILQELQYNSKLSGVTVTDKTMGMSNKVNGISVDFIDSVVSPNISGEDDITCQGGISGKRKAPDNKVLGRTVPVMSIPLEATSKTPVPEKTTKVIEPSESREILQSDVSLCEAEVATDHVISSGDFSNGEIVSLKVKEGPDHEVPEMVDAVNDRRISAEDSNSSVMDPTMTTTDGNLLFEQTDKESVHVNIKQVVVESTSCQKMIADDVSASGTSVDLNLREGTMSAFDVVRGDNNEYLGGTQMSATRKSEKDTVDQVVKATAAAPGSPSKPDQPEMVSSSRSTELPEMDNASSPASASHLSTSDSLEKTEEKQSLWGNLKSFASGLINIWRKS